MSDMRQRFSRSGRNGVLLAVTIVVLAGSAVGAVPHAAAAASTVGKYESDVATYTNTERSKRGTSKTKANACLDGFAESQAAKMAKKKSLQHQDLRPILTKCKLNRVGENIAMGYPSGKTATAAWMRSSGHKANILNKGYSLHGVGAYRDSSGAVWVSHVFGGKA